MISVHSHIFYKYIKSFQLLMVIILINIGNLIVDKIGTDLFRYDYIISNMSI